MDPAATNPAVPDMMRHVLMLLRYDDPGAADLEPALAHVLAVLGDQPGFAWGCVGRSPDEPRQWVLAARWDDVGAMRRGVGCYDAKIALGPLQRFSADGSGAFEVLGEQVAGAFVRGTTDRAPDADRAGPGEHA